MQKIVALGLLFLLTGCNTLDSNSLRSDEWDLTTPTRPQVDASVKADNEIEATQQVNEVNAVDEYILSTEAKQNEAALTAEVAKQQPVINGAY